MALATVWLQGLTVEDRDGALDDYSDSSASGRETSVLVQLPDDDSLEAVEEADRKSTRLNSSHVSESRMPSSA